MKVSEISKPRRIATTAAVAILALAVGACSGGSSTTSGSAPTTPPASSAAASPSASLPGTGSSPSAAATSPAPTQQVHATERGEPPVVTVRGFTYNDSGADLDVAAQLAKSLNAGSKGLATGSSTHLVESTSGNGFMVLRLAMGAKARALSDSRWNSLLAPMVASFAGAESAKTVTVAGERMSFARGTEGGETRLAYAWLHGRVLTIVIAVTPSSPKTQAAEALKLVAAHVAAQKG